MQFTTTALFFGAASMVAAAPMPDNQGTVGGLDLSHYLCDVPQLQDITELAIANAVEYFWGVGWHGNPKAPAFISVNAGATQQRISCSGHTGVYIDVDSHKSPSPFQFNAADFGTAVNGVFNECFHHYPGRDYTTDGAFIYYGDGYNLTVKGNADCA